MPVFAIIAISFDCLYPLTKMVRKLTSRGRSLGSSVNPLYCDLPLQKVSKCHRATTLAFMSKSAWENGPMFFEFNCTLRFLWIGSFGLSSKVVHLFLLHPTVSSKTLQHAKHSLFIVSDVLDTKMILSACFHHGKVFKHAMLTSRYWRIF